MASVLLASLFHETHCFVDDRTGPDRFRLRRSDEILGRAGDGSGVDGFLEVAAADRCPSALAGEGFINWRDHGTLVT